MYIKLFFLCLNLLSLGGYIDNIQFYYAARSKVKFFCDVGLQLHGSQMIQCLGK